MMKIRVENLSFAYDGGDQILSGVNLEIERGEVLTLVGPNGCGKTTLIKNIAGGLPPDTGAVYIDFHEISSLSAAELASQLAVVQQEARVGFDFTVEEIVEMGRIPHLSRFQPLEGNDREAIKNAMRKTGITDLAPRSIRTLSGGERQRVFLACALAQNPQVLLLDEPTSSLDINHQIEIMEIVRERISKGVTSVMALHDLNLAANFSDSIALMEEGSIFKMGPPGEVLTRDNIYKIFQTEVTVGKNPVTNSVYVDMPPPKVNSERSKEMQIHVVCGGGSGTSVLHELAKHFRISCGIISPLDTDYEVARHFDIETVVEAPFSPISNQSQRKNRRMMKQSDAIVICETPFGEGNVSSLDGVVTEASQTPVFILNPKEIQTRDFTSNNRATELINELLERGGKAIKNSNELIEEIKEAGC